MCLFEKGLEVVNVKKYKKILGKASIELMIESMAREYLDSSDKDKLLIKYRIQDILNDIEKVTIISIIISIATSILGYLFELRYKYIIITIFIIYFIITVFLVDLVKYHRICKIYLEVIKDIKEGEIELGKDCDDNYYVRFNKREMVECKRIDRLN